MANSYTQIHLQIVFAVAGRQRLIIPGLKEELERYITGIIQAQHNKLLAINCQPDHTHIVVGMHPDNAPSHLVRDIKANSATFISSKGLLRGQFHWQNGYGAFSYAKEDLMGLITYVRNQEAHHRQRTFREEYLELLKMFGVEYDERYLFQWIQTGL